MVATGGDSRRHAALDPTATAERIEVVQRSATGSPRVWLDVRGVAPWQSTRQNTQMEPLTPQDIAPEGGLRVVLLSDHSWIGVVLKRAGPRVRVDFSPSGGPNSKWVEAQELCRAAVPEGSDITQLG
eukprot:COSAG01_NODE_42260_length_441_cov_49.716374_1_plen_126_part_10